MTEKNNILYEFSFSTEKERGKYWYIIVFSIVIAIIIWGFLTKQYGLSFIIMLFSGVYILLENNVETNNINVKITDLGIFLNNNFYEYETIDSFSILYDNSQAIFLRLYFKSGIRFLDLNINNDIVKDLKNILINYIELKKDDKLSNIDKLIRILKL